MLVGLLGAVGAGNTAITEKPAEQVHALVVAVRVRILLRAAAIARLLLGPGRVVGADIHDAHVQPLGELAEFVAELPRVRDHQGSGIRRHLLLVPRRFHAGVDQRTDQNPHR